MIRSLAHLNFVTNDLSKFMDFYVNKLGLKVKFTLDNKEGQPFGYYFECGNTTFLEFFDQEMAAQQWGGNVDQLMPGNRYRHFCLEVTGLDEFCEVLKSKACMSRKSGWAWIMPGRRGSLTRMATKSS